MLRVIDKGRAQFARAAQKLAGMGLMVLGAAVSAHATAPDGTVDLTSVISTGQTQFLFYIPLIVGAALVVMTATSGSGRLLVWLKKAFKSS